MLRGQVARASSLTAICEKQAVSPELSSGAVGEPSLVTESGPCTLLRACHTPCVERLLTIPQCPRFTEEGTEVQGETFVWGHGADLGRGQGPSADGGPLGARRCGRAEVAGRSRTLRGPKPSGPWARPPSPGLPAVGAGGPGAGSRARARAPLSPAAAASPSLGGPSAGRYLLSPGRAPSRLPARPWPPWRRAAPALSSAARPASCGPRLTPAPPRAAPSPTRPLPKMPPPRVAPSPAAPLRAAPSGAKLQGALSPRGTASEKGVRLVLFLKDKPNYA